MSKNRLLCAPLGMMLAGILGCALVGLSGCDLGGSDEEQPELVATIYMACGDEIRLVDVYEFDDGTVPPGNFEIVLTDPDMNSRDIQVDAVGAKLYWT